MSFFYNNSAVNIVHGWDGEVTNYSELPDPSTVNGKIYKVLTAQGTWILGTKKKAG